MIIEKIKSIIINNKLFKHKENVLVCVSGGSDSVFLLEALSLINDIYKLNIYVAHLNHSLRGKESDADEVFVRKLALKLGIPFLRARVDIAKISRQNKMSIEQAARFARYNFFSNISKANGIKKIVLAHTKDDQVETVLMRILRGTGIKGLGAMRFLSEVKNMLLIRPLLNIEKHQILRYLNQNRIKFRIDSSNLEKNYFRNKIRLEALPALEKLSPALKDNIIRLSDNAQKTESFLQEKLKQVYSRIVSSGRKNELKIEQVKFLKLMPIMRSELIRKVIFDLIKDINGIDYKHINIIDNFIEHDFLSGSSLDLPRSIKVSKLRKYIKFEIVKKNKVDTFLNKKFSLQLNKELVIKSWGYVFKVEKVLGKINIKRKPKGVEYFDLDKLKFPLTVRTKLEGDWFKPLGSKGIKKIKKFFIDQKIDRDEKSEIPLILSRDEVILVGDLRISDNYKVTDKTKNIIKIFISKIK